MRKVVGTSKRDAARATLAAGKLTNRQHMRESGWGNQCTLSRINAQRALALYSGREG